MSPRAPCTVSESRSSGVKQEVTEKHQLKRHVLFTPIARATLAIALLSVLFFVSRFGTIPFGSICFIFAGDLRPLLVCVHASGDVLPFKRRLQVLSDEGSAQRISEGKVRGVGSVWRDRCVTLALTSMSLLLLVLRVRTTPHVNGTSCGGRAHFVWVVKVARAVDGPLIPSNPRVHRARTLGVTFLGGTLRGIGKLIMIRNTCIATCQSYRCCPCRCLSSSQNHVPPG